MTSQCFHKTLGTRRRQWPPSKQEILCTINRRPIYARFHFMDGQFHAIEFDPSATANEVLKLVQSKIGLRDDAEGAFALPESPLCDFQGCLTIIMPSLLRLCHIRSARQPGKEPASGRESG